MTFPAFKHISSTAVLVELATEISDDTHDQVIALDRALAANTCPGLLEVVPALVNLLVVFYPVETDHNAIEQHLRNFFPLGTSEQSAPKLHTIPTVFGGASGPDLENVTAITGLSLSEVIKAHCDQVLRVGMYGFAPGYAYLTGMDMRLRLPRKQTPVRDVPKGAVMIAGAQCLITTMVMPSGWHVIGQTKVDVLQEDADNPFLFEVGDMVQFTEIETSVPT